MKTKSLLRSLCPQSLLSVLIFGASFSPHLTAAPRAGTPPAWRAHGSAPLDGGPFKPRPLSAARGGSRSISPASTSAPTASANTAQPAASVFQPMSATASSDADYQTADLIALAAGLKNDRDTIFSWVRDNIRYVHYHGCKKGAQLTYLERSGNDIDQAALLVALWRAAGVNCQYVYGLIEMPVVSANQIDWYHYLGADGTADGTSGQLEQLVFSRGTPSGYFGVYSGHSANTRALTRLWVQANVNGSWINYDPSFKLIQPVTPNLDVTTAMGYSRSNLLASLGAGSVAPNSVTSLNYTGLSAYLAGRVTQLLSALRNSAQSNTVEQTIGGWVPLPSSTVSGNSFPIAAAGYFWGTYSGNVYDVLPATLYATVQISAPAVGLSWGPINLASLRGQRLGLAFESGIAKLKLEDIQIAAASSSLATGSPLDVNVSIVHAESGAVATGVQVNESTTLKSKGDGTYALVYGFDVSSEYLKSRQEQLDLYRQQNVPDTDQRMRLETLNVIGLNWLLQTELDHQLVATLKGQAPAYLHRFGRVAHELAAGTNYSVYIDVPMNFSGFVSRSADPGSANRLTAEMADSFIASAMEHGVIEQTQPDTGSSVVSTTKVLKLANDAGMPVFLATDQTTWNAVQPSLQNYGASDTALMSNAISQGGQVLVPKAATITSGHWTGGAYAYSWLNATSLGQGMIIGGGYSGGYAGIYIANPLSLPIYNLGSSSSFRYETAPVTIERPYYGDPVDAQSGDFTHERELLTTGRGLVRGLNFSVSYHGARRFKNEAKIGYGWTHSYYARATERADIEGAFGKKTPVEMATSLAGVIAALDLFANRAGPKDWLATALVANWTVDQLKGSDVAIVAGDRIWDFHKQGDGSYSPPPASTFTLSRDTAYHLTERNGPVWNFDSSNRLAQIQDLWGKSLTLTYNANGDLQTVSDAYGRTYTFTYGGPGGMLSLVSDNSSQSRSVGLNVDGNGDLDSYSDPEGKVDSFSYNAGHLVWLYFNHDGQIVLQNNFDANGRVSTQYTAGNSSNTWRYYYSPGMTIISEPTSTSPAETTHFFDSRKRETEVINPLGEHSITYYDGQDRVIAREQLIPNGSGGWAVDDVEYMGYDVSHNLLWSTDPQGYVTNYAYDGSNHLLSITDKRNHAQSFQGYNAQHQPTQTTDRAERVVLTTYQPSTDPGAGELASTTEGGFVTTYHYDAKGALDLTTFPGGASAGRTNNDLGDPTILTDENGRQTSMAYNKRRESITRVEPGTASSGARTISRTYDNERNLASQQDGRGNLTRYAYSSSRKLLTTTLPSGALVTNHYNTRDEVDWTSNPLSQRFLFAYDGLGRATSATDPLNRTTSTVYEDAARRTTVQGPVPLSIQTKLTVDNRGQAIADQNGRGDVASPGYDPSGNKSGWTDRRGKLWQFTFDNEDRRKTTQSPLGRTMTQSYDSRGLLTSVQRPSGQTTTFGYDGRRRLVNRQDTVGLISFTLDNSSQVTAVTEGSATLQRTYHASGQVATYTNANSETIAYDYDRAGNLISLTYPAIGTVPAATVTYTYDNCNRLSSVTDWNGNTTTYTWDLSGRLTQVTRPNGTSRILRWDAASQQVGFEEHTTTGQPISVASFQYDVQSRVAKRVVYPQGNTWAEPAWTGLYNDDNQLTSIGGTALSYDLDGNLNASPLPNGPWGASGTSTNAVGSYTWNSRSQLTGVLRGDNAQQVQYAYDSEGHMIQRTSNEGVTRYIVDPNGSTMSRILATVSPSGAVTRYIYGLGLVSEVRASGVIRYYHYDRTGSTIALTDASGAVTGTADYSPYGALQGTGELANAAATPFLFIGAFGVVTDADTGLHQMRARWYSTYLRRFLSADPSGLEGGENIYAYADGNPVSLLDPSGLSFSAVNWFYSGMGAVRVVGGAFEAAAGYALVGAAGTFGVATLPSVGGPVLGAAGVVGGIAIGAHGLDQVQAGLRQMFSGEHVDSLTAGALQSAGMSPRAANLTDAGISVVGSFGAGSVATGFRAVTASTSAAPEVAGASILTKIKYYEAGQVTFPQAVFDAQYASIPNVLDRGAQILQDYGSMVNVWKASSNTLGIAENTLRFGPTPIATGAVGSAGGAIFGYSVVLTK